MKINYNLIKSICQLYSLLFCFAQSYLLLYPMFILAYSTKLYECTMYINLHGEADIEMILWMVTFPIVIYGLYLNLKVILIGMFK